MNDRPTVHVELLLLCGKVRDDALTAADAARLDELLQSSDDAKALFVQYMTVASLLESRGAGQRESEVEPEVSGTIHEDVLAELLQAERDAEPVAFPRQVFEPRPVEAKTDQLTRQQVGSAAAYLFNQAKGRTKVWASLAAVLALALVLIVVFRPGTTPAPIADKPNQAPAVSTTQVATLTAEHNAVWDQQPGEDLHPNQRLTLTAGFAEITTNRGAIAILEAPATIELLDHNNALRLHAGKLVGICETDSSKGFLIRTPHMDITDLGTRFGVDATRHDHTQVHVFEGEVEAIVPPSRQTKKQRQRLTSGQALAAEESGALTAVPYAPMAFTLSIGIDHLRPDFAGTNAVWLGAVSGDLGQNKQQADTLQVFMERTSLVLAKPVGVDVTRGGAWDPDAESGAQQIAGGERVDVYLLHYDRLTPSTVRQDFVLDFGRPILGVITVQAGLDATDATLGVDRVAYPDFSSVPAASRYGPPRGLNANSFIKDETDIASVEADGRTLRLSLWGGKDASATMDQIRVIVRAAEDAP